jgi:hypothetical protein
MANCCTGQQPPLAWLQERVLPLEKPMLKSLYVKQDLACSEVFLWQLQNLISREIS